MPIVSVSADGTLLWRGRSYDEILENLKRSQVVEVFDAQRNGAKGLECLGRREGIWTYYKCQDRAFRNMKILEDGTDQKICEAVYVNDVVTGEVKVFGKLPAGETIESILGRFESMVGAYERKLSLLRIVLDTFRTDNGGARTIAALQVGGNANNVETVWALMHAFGVSFTQAIEMQKTKQIPKCLN